MARKNSRLGFPITHPGYVYSCANCGGEVKKKPCMAAKEKPVKKGGKIGANGFIEMPKKSAPLSGLHGWRCANGCAIKRRASVTKDISGGKEADKGNREVGVTVTRPLKVHRVLRTQEKPDAIS